MQGTPRDTKLLAGCASRRPGGFQPPHCPNPKCTFHQPRPDWRFVRHGHHRRQRDGRRVQDYRCKHCGRSFCAAAFSTAYWLKRPALLIPVATLITEGAGIRQAARALGVSPSTVARLVGRLGRHCLLLHRTLIHEAAIDEPLVIDGFESFEYSQFFPFHANLAVGARSWFLYHFTDSPLRRKGTMTRGQRRKRAHLEATVGRPNPKAVELGIASLLRPLLPRVATSPLRLHSDDHPAYRRALRRLRREGLTTPAITHHITSSKLRRTQSNPLFPVNLADLLLRHGSANHRRETIAFSKRRQAALERLAVFTVWRNYVKKRREKEPRPGETAAMSAGILPHPLTWRQTLKRRLFPARVPLPPAWRSYYEGQVKTLMLGQRQSAHRCRYAF